MDAPLSIGLSALLAAQKGIDVAGHNIANVSTPNYSRQRLELASSAPGYAGRLATGYGVERVRISATRDRLVEQMLLAQDPLAGAAARRSQVLAQVEGLFSTDPETSLGSVMDDFFGSFDELAREPSSAAARQGVVSNGQRMTAAFGDLARQIADLRQEIVPAVADACQQVNRLTAQIADLNNLIRDDVAAGGDPNDLVDQQNTALRQLAELLPVQTNAASLGRTEVLSGGLLLVSIKGHTDVTRGFNGEALEVHAGDSPLALQFASGQLGALLELHNATLPGYLGSLDSLAAAIVREVNLCQTTGVGRGGAFTALDSSNAVAVPAAPLNASGLPFPLESGSLYVSVTERATGAVTQARIDINPDSHGLTALAGALDAVAGIRASVGGGLLHIEANEGYAFDFTNKVATHPGALGGATPTFRGAVTLDANDAYTLTVDTSQTADGPGAAATIGSTAGLRIRVTNAAGATVATLDVGEAYEPGSALALPGGISVALDGADVADGDALTVELAAEPDAQGLLAALGVNTLLRGTSAATMGVDPAVAADPARVAAARSNSAGDNSNALRLAALQDKVLPCLGGTTLGGSYAQLAGRIGLDSLAAQRSEDSTSLLREATQNQRDAISGVNQDEEAVNLLRFQQLYMFAARYLKTIDELTDLLMSI